MRQGQKKSKRKTRNEKKNSKKVDAGEKTKTKETKKIEREATHNHALFAATTASH